jgi:Ulp1 family protease
VHDDADNLFVYPLPPNDQVRVAQARCECQTHNHAQDAVTVNTRDLARTAAGEYLNDTLIELYFKYLLFERLDAVGC